MPEYDVAIIGSGPGGYVAAIRAAQLGLQTALIEKDALGGLCLNWGCVPSKALLHAADLIGLFKRGSEFGISCSELSCDLGVSVDRSREVVARFTAGIETLLSQNGVTLVRGTARLASANRVELSPAGEALAAHNVVIATGGVMRSLPGLELDGERLIGSREALALRQAPQSLVIVGGGASGVEFAYLFSSYGSRVTLLELAPGLLPGEDEDVSRQLERSFREQGIAVITGASVTGATTGPDGVRVGFVREGKAEEATAEKALVCVGLTGSTEGLGLEESGVEVERGFVKIDDYCRTSVPGVWAIGDVTGRLQLAHVASHQGVTAVEMIAGGEPVPLDYDRMPRAVYCRPQVAGLGLTEQLARERGIAVRTGRFPLRANGKALAIGETEGFVKLVVDAASGALVGFHAVGANATEMLGEASLAALLEATPAELGLSVHPHPTLSEALREAALAVSGEAIHFYSARRGSASPAGADG